MSINTIADLIQSTTVVDRSKDLTDEDMIAGFEQWLGGRISDGEWLRFVGLRIQQSREPARAAFGERLMGISKGVIEAEKRRFEEACREAGLENLFEALK